MKVEEDFGGRKRKWRDVDDEGMEMSMDIEGDDVDMEVMKKRKLSEDNGGAVEVVVNRNEPIPTNRPVVRAYVCFVYLD